MHSLKVSGWPSKKFDIKVGERSETPRRSDFLVARLYIWRSCLKNCYNAVDRIAMPLLGTLYDVINVVDVLITHEVLSVVIASWASC